jgi:iron complex transport system substrate-binding protein
LRRRDFATGAASVLVACGGSKTAPSSAVARRIVSQVVDADETLYDLGHDVRRRVVGVSAMADDARYTKWPQRWPSDVPRVAAGSEALLATKPDLVFVAEFSAAEGRALLEASGIRTVVLKGFDGFDDYRRRVSEIGDAVGASTAAEALLRRFDRDLARVSAKPSATPPAALSWVDGNVAGRGTSFDDVATAAGLTNLGAQRGITGHRAVPLEQVVAWDPAIVITQCDDAQAGDCERAATTLASSPGWSATRAARDRGIIPVPSRLLYSAGWGMVDTVEWIVRARAG